MEAKRFILRNEDVLANAQAFLSAVKIDDQHPMEVVVRKYKRNRSLEQNALLHKWLAIIADETGNSMQDIKDYCKDTFLPPVTKSVMGKEIEARAETSKMTVAELSDFMNKIEAFAADLGIVLPHPEDRWAA